MLGDGNGHGQVHVHGHYHCQVMVMVKLMVMVWNVEGTQRGTQKTQSQEKACNAKERRGNSGEKKAEPIKSLEHKGHTERTCLGRGE